MCSFGVWLQKRTCNRKPLVNINLGYHIYGITKMHCQNIDAYGRNCGNQTVSWEFHSI